MLRINEIRLGLDEDMDSIPEKIIKRLGIRRADLLSWAISKESIDARNKEDIKLIYSVTIETRNEKELLRKAAGYKLEKCERTVYAWPEAGLEELRGRPVVVGFGPCGMFAALVLAERGYKPVVIERGKPMDERSADVQDFWRSGKLLAESNVQFGEGGAGAFSDGKLTTGIRDRRLRKVLEELVEAGGPEDILYKQKPHIGTDILRKAVVNIREKIIGLGGEIRFRTRLAAITPDGIGVHGPDASSISRIPAEAVILSIGHSARDTMAMLYEAGLEMEQKPFSIGVRIEHPQSFIDRAQYGGQAGNRRLGAAEYKLSHHCASGRGVYTFCMCPGGHVIGAASEEGGVVTNGMSYHSRSAANANSAALVDVRTEDFASLHPLAGIEFQRRWERAAFELGGGTYKAPAQRIGDFLGPGIHGADRGGTDEESGEWSADADQIRILPTYKPGVVWSDLHRCLPDFALEALEEALPAFGRKIRGFDHPDGILTGVETRSSSPVRIRRDESLRGSIRRIYPAGEGAGYAGGIVSAAVDGIKAAEAIIETYAPLK